MPLLGRTFAPTTMRRAGRRRQRRFLVTSPRWRPRGRRPHDHTRWLPPYGRRCRAAGFSFSERRDRRFRSDGVRARRARAATDRTSGTSWRSCAPACRSKPLKPRCAPSPRRSSREPETGRGIAADDRAAARARLRAARRRADVHARAARRRRARAADRLRQRREPDARARDGAAEGARDPQSARRRARPRAAAAADRERAARGRRRRRRPRHRGGLLRLPVALAAEHVARERRRWRSISRVLALTIAAALVTVLLFGAGPAFAAARRDFGAAFGRAVGTHGKAARRLRTALVVARDRADGRAARRCGLAAAQLRNRARRRSGLRRRRVCSSPRRCCPSRATEPRRTTTLFYQRVLDERARVARRRERGLHELRAADVQGRAIGRASSTAARGPSRSEILRNLATEPQRERGLFGDARRSARQRPLHRRARRARRGAQRSSSTRPWRARYWPDEDPHRPAVQHRRPAR